MTLATKEWVINLLQKTFHKIMPNYFSFGIDSDGNYGYIKQGQTTVTPFKNGDVYYVNIIGCSVTGNNACGVFTNDGTKKYFNVNNKTYTAMSSSTAYNQSFTLNKDCKLVITLNCTGRGNINTNYYQAAFVNNIEKLRLTHTGAGANSISITLDVTAGTTIKWTSTRQSNPGPDSYSAIFMVTE